MSRKLPPCLTIEDFEQKFQDRHLLHGAVEKWAREKPLSIALIDSNRNRAVSCAEFESVIRVLAMLLVKRGLR